MKQPRKSYMQYYKCDACGYPASLPAKWAAIGHPRCLNPNCAKKTQPLTLQKPRFKAPAESAEESPGEGETSAGNDVPVAAVSKDAYTSSRIRILTELMGHSEDEARRIFAEEQAEALENS